MRGAWFIWPAAGLVLLMTLFGWVVEALPALVFRYFPTQDGPAHLYTSMVLSALHSGSDHGLGRYFELRQVPFANQLANWLIAGAAQLVRMPYAESAAWVAVFGAFAATVTVNLAAAGTRAVAFAPMFFVIAAGYLTNMGFINFLIALILFAQTVFVVQQGLCRPSIGRVLAVAVLSGVTYAAHPLAGLSLAAALGTFAAGYLGLGALAAWPSARRVVQVEGGFSWLVPLGCGLACSLLLGLSVHDAWSQIERFSTEMAGVIDRSPASQAPGDGPLSRLVKLLSFSYLISFSAIDLVFAGVFGLIVAWLIWRRGLAFYQQRRLLLADSWLVAIVVLTVLIMTVPHWFEGYLPDRLTACFLILLVVWLATQELDRATARRLLVIGVALNIGLLVWRLDRTAAIEGVLAEYATIDAALPDSASVITLSNLPAPGQRCRGVFAGPLPCRFQPTAHFDGRIAAGRKLALLSNYQLAPDAGYFPVALRAPWSDLEPTIPSLGMLRWNTPALAKATNKVISGLANVLDRQPVDVIVVWDDASVAGEPDQQLRSGIAPILAQYREVFVSKPRGAARVYWRANPPASSPVDTRSSGFGTQDRSAE